MYFRQNYQLVIFIIFIMFGINIALWVQRAYYFRDFSTLNGSRPNPFYMLSRANGELFNILLAIPFFNATYLVEIVWIFIR